MSKTIEIEFPAGTVVFVMHQNKPKKTIIRAVQYTGTSEVVSAKGNLTRVETERTIYSTPLAPNTSLTANQIGATEEELMAKLFPTAAAAENNGSENGGSENGGSENGGSENGGSENNGSEDGGSEDNGS